MPSDAAEKAWISWFSRRPKGTRIVIGAHSLFTAGHGFGQKRKAIGAVTDAEIETAWNTWVKRNAKLKLGFEARTFFDEGYIAGAESRKVSEWERFLKTDYKQLIADETGMKCG